ncbi:MAG: PIN domain-containing protein [Opitutus sp.]|nr:PIN domain-containing protein [Opitutus sp.]
MTYLADVNVLLALAWSHHPHHDRVRVWWAGLGQGEAFATCAITELGFVRISLQPAFASADIGQAKLALAQLRAARPGHVFLADTVGADALPPWVKTAQQTSDGHLAALAAAHGAKLATLDTGIPGALLIA